MQNSDVLIEPAGDWQSQQGCLFAIDHILSCRPSVFPLTKTQLLPFLCTSLKHERAQVREAAVHVLGDILKLKRNDIIMQSPDFDFLSVVEEILTTITTNNLLLNDSSSNVKISIMRSLQQMMKIDDSFGRIWIHSLTDEKRNSVDILSMSISSLIFCSFSSTIDLFVFRHIRSSL
jgi:hypothetical protein